MSFIALLVFAALFLTVAVQLMFRYDDFLIACVNTGMRIDGRGEEIDNPILTNSDPRVAAERGPAVAPEGPLAPVVLKKNLPKFNDRD